MVEGDIGAVEVVAGRQAGLEHQHRRARLGQRHALERGPDVPVRAERVDADIRVAGVDEDLLVLLIPRIERVPVEAGRACHPVDRVVAEDPHGARPVQAARAQAVAACRALAEPLLVVFVDEEARVDVLGRDVVLRVVRPFPHVPRPGGVENLHRPHRSLDSVAPLEPLPESVDLEQYRVQRHPRVSGMINEYRMVA
jgi:hypothetical protein